MHVHSGCLQICRHGLVEFLHVVFLLSTVFAEDYSFQFVGVFFAGFEPQRWIFHVWLHSYFSAYPSGNTRSLRPRMTQSKNNKEIKTIEPKKIIVTNAEKFHMYSQRSHWLFFFLAQHMVNSTTKKQGGRSRETQISCPCARFISLCFYPFSRPWWV